MSRTRKLSYWITKWEHLTKQYIALGGHDPAEYMNGLIVPKYLRRYGQKWLRRKVSERSPFMAVFMNEVHDREPGRPRVRADLLARRARYGLRA